MFFLLLHQPKSIHTLDGDHKKPRFVRWTKLVGLVMKNAFVNMVGIYMCMCVKHGGMHIDRKKAFNFHELDPH
jgi:hypothetical protein